ncbi:uncharacterized protein DNG_06895 [Cephalotrichum gorgonifer]|uniref:VPS37 C-terminal domain-containing protein n=1 Tax=Cephalotrichum gorgonifer TaxID=2041049 RepID=A0AAE8N3L6_9PEZI|nr:uncharacterized protein DNG_06895 [Cephalotrichum gorgonifer]
MEGNAPILPPKPNHHDSSRIGTPHAPNNGPAPPPRPESTAARNASPSSAQGVVPGDGPHQERLAIRDPGDTWIPPSIQDMGKQDLSTILHDPRLVHAVTHSPETIHPSVSASHEQLQAALSENIELGVRLRELESRVSAERSSAQAQLLSTHALERQWRQKQSDLDGVLEAFSPASLYQRLGQGVQEQGMICQALEESFLESSGGEAVASDRETADWIRRYREAKTLYYLRQQRKERWDEGRVGGWR